MESINVSLPEDLKEWVEAESANGHNGSASDYFCNLARRDREQKIAMLRSSKQMTIGINSGVSALSFDEIIDEARLRADALGFAHE